MPSHSTTKHCRRCGQDLPFAAFDHKYLSDGRKNGYRRHCRACRDEVRARQGRPVDERFWAQVTRDAGDGCWLWQGGCDQDGYGVYSVDGGSVRAHRFAWDLVHGPIPEGFLVLHRCDVRRCVNAERHLFLGSSLDNARDRDAKGRGGVLRGEDRPFAKLTAGKVVVIRELYAQAGISLDELARRHGVSLSAIHHVVRRVTWKHV